MLNGNLFSEMLGAVVVYFKQQWGAKMLNGNLFSGMLQAVVVYFNQQWGAAHPKRSSKS